MADLHMFGQPNNDTAKIDSRMTSDTSFLLRTVSEILISADIQVVEWQQRSCAREKLKTRIQAHFAGLGEPQESPQIATKSKRRWSSASLT